MSFTGVQVSDSPFEVRYYNKTKRTTDYRYWANNLLFYLRGYGQSQLKPMNSLLRIQSYSDEESE